MMKIKAIVHSEPDGGGYWAEVPSLPGCFTEGDTLKDLEINLKEAVEGWLLAGEPEPIESQQLLEIAV